MSWSLTFAVIYTPYAIIVLNMNSSFRQKEEFALQAIKLILSIFDLDLWFYIGEQKRVL